MGLGLRSGVRVLIVARAGIVEVRAGIEVETAASSQDGIAAPVADTAVEMS